MKRIAVLIILLLLAWATPVAAQRSIVAAIRANYPTPLAEKHGAFLIEVACATKKGLLRKDWGTFVRLPDGTGVSQDIVMEKDGSQHYDILGDGEGAAVPTWEPIGPIDASRYYPPLCAPSTDPIELPVDLPPAGGDTVAALAARIKQLEAQVSALQSDLNGARADTEALHLQWVETDRQLNEARAERDALKNAPPPSCEAKVPAALRALGIRIGCRIVPEPAR